MCGLVGMAGDLHGGHDRVLRSLLILDSLRGEDSAGVAFVGKYGNGVQVAKALGDPFNLFNDGKYEKGLRTVNKVMIGHNRYATSGGVNKAGAHPFEFDTLVGAHNGTIGSRYRLDDDKDFKVDSQALYWNIEKNGVKETIRRLGGAGNAWSLVWWDKKELTLNFLRNTERPMWMCRSKDGKVLFWASEAWMLLAALGKANMEHQELFTTDVNMHYSLPINNQGVMGKPVVQEVKPDPVQVLLPQPQANNNGKPPFIHNKTTQNAPTTSNVVALTPTGTNKAVSEVAANVGKSQGSSAGNSGLASDLSYLSVKERKFEILCERTDGNGGRYLALFDEKEQFVDIRLYPCKQDQYLFDMEGEDIIGDISEFSRQDPKALRGYYKVSPWTVKLVITAPQEGLLAKAMDQAFKDAIGDDSEAENETTMDHRGKLITKKEFEMQYSSCNWCSSPLSFGDRNRFTTGGECLCPSCAKDPEVTQYVNLM